MCFPDKDGSSDTTIMYYINDGVYGSLSFILLDPAHCKLEPYLHRVNIHMSTYD